jgi:hypothetical protein
MTDELSRAAERLAVAIESNFTCDYQQIVKAYRGSASWALHDHGADLIEVALALDNYRRIEQSELSTRSATVLTDKVMNENLPIHLVPRKVDTFELVCWHCHQTVEVAVTEQPQLCPLCRALLVIEWRSVR